MTLEKFLRALEIHINENKFIPPFEKAIFKYENLKFSFFIQMRENTLYNVFLYIDNNYITTYDVENFSFLSSEIKRGYADGGSMSFEDFMEFASKIYKYNKMRVFS